MADPKGKLRRFVIYVHEAQERKAWPYIHEALKAAPEKHVTAFWLVGEDDVVEHLK